MCSRNDIPYLLSFRRMEVNGKAQLWYDITGMESLRDRMRRQGVSAEGLKEVMECLNGVWWEMRRFLLRQEHIYLSPDTIFFGDDGMIRLCYFPVNAADPFGQMREVMEFILTLVEEDQEETAELCYRLYDIALQEHYSFSQMLECVGAFCGRTGLQGEEATSETGGTCAADTGRNTGGNGTAGRGTDRSSWNDGWNDGRIGCGGDV